MHRVATDELELAVDLEARLLQELSPDAYLGQLLGLDHPTGQRPAAIALVPDAEHPRLGHEHARDARVRAVYLGEAIDA